ncbi:septal ring lytic transglycosylase RlpA family protein|uniref:septal ring lytic transglycosylase RlpA family protein n=1 Tax=Noviherbaspirillum sp. L7-7A TaxID=2850560 RepID=UPI001C2CC225|nr:septal ring lytic transglycosylase RlpA family protein [Noviherbaspirillum sp. L7-7A]MBV0880476.1 septal ring lytic transglycosylase RlpA family protein [Noviherbaspirillum sp. L7-7A]
MHLPSRPWPGTAILCAAVAFIAAGCGSAPQQQSADANAGAVPAKSARRGLPSLPPAGSGRGGYYQDDGPGENIPDNLWDVPDAEPRIEPYANRGNKPYVVFGKEYVPQMNEEPVKQRGRGSWYGRKFHGQRTSSGEPYDMYKMTAAHPTFPIPSYARVTNLSNGNTVIVRVNDRGPFHSDRIIDLSYTAALKLGYIGHGSAQLEVERILPDEIRRMELARSNGAAPALASAAPSAPGVSTEAVPMPVTMVSAPAELMAPPAAAPAAASTMPAASSVSTVSAAAGGFYLQLGAFSQAANAQAAQAVHAQRWNGSLRQVDIVHNNTLFRLYGGPFASRADAEAVARQMQASGGAMPIIVQR